LLGVGNSGNVAAIDLSEEQSHDAKDNDADQQWQAVALTTAELLIAAGVPGSIHGGIPLSIVVLTHAEAPGIVRKNRAEPETGLRGTGALPPGPELLSRKRLIPANVLAR
jgi:hypothetical protein